MYVRIKTIKNSNKRSVQIVESYRNDKNKPRQKILRHVGTVSTDKELERLKDFAEYEIANLESEKSPSLFKPEYLAELAIEARKKSKEDEEINVNLKKLKEESRIVTGIHEAFGKVYDELGFDSLFTTRHIASKKNLRHLTMARIAKPTSKKQSVINLENDFGINLSLDGVYRMMDQIDDIMIEKAQKKVYKNTKILLGNKISIVFYDCTTLYFESFIEDELKRNGYSKDMKFNQSQVVLGLLMSSAGLPIGYEVFPGSQYEGYTLKTILPRLKENFDIDRVIFTADSAMLSASNLNYLEESGMEYIVAARLKNMNQNWIDKITSEKKSIRKFDYDNNRKLIVTYSETLAKKNKFDRDKTIEKLKQKLNKSKNPASLISNYGYKRFLKVTGNVNIEIDENKYLEAAKFDGFHGVISNVNDLTAEEIIEQYKFLWQIEECFRVSKTDLKIRPIYHWTPKRIKAHILICFMALVCVKNLAYRIKLRYESMSVARIVNAMNHIQASILYNTTNQERYVLPSKINEDAKKIFKTLNIKINSTPYKLIQKD